MKNAIPCLIAALSWLPACAGPAPSQEPVVREEPGQEGERLRISASEEGIPIADWIRMAERVTGNAYTYSAAEIEGAEPIRFVGTISVQKDKFSDLFRTMLYIRGFAVVPHGEGDMKIVPLHG